MFFRTIAVLIVSAVLMSGAAPADAATPTRFVITPNGSSGTTETAIPTVKAVKKTIAAYYGDPGTGIADKKDSPYIDELTGILDAQTAKLQVIYDKAIAAGEKPAMVFDIDDTTLLTYDMEVGAYDYDFDRATKNSWIRTAKFAAVPGMVAYVEAAASVGFTIFGLTGRALETKQGTLRNLRKVGYTAFSSDKLYTKRDRSYIQCAKATCTTVEYKAYTRKHIEKLGYDIQLNVGDQWSDLKGGYADRTLKLPNPLYFLSSPNLPGLKQGKLRPRIEFTMKADGSSGLTEGGEGIPNHDAVVAMIAVAKKK
jgi:hypothetical protein